MGNKILVFLLVFWLTCLIVFVHSLVDSIKTSHTSSNFIDIGCNNCSISDYQVCVDGNCYCQSNFIVNSNGTGCIYKACAANSDCRLIQDFKRYCRRGSCICEPNYVEDWNNGRKCIVNVVPLWTCVAIFFIVPILLFIYHHFVIIHQAHSDLSAYSPI